jgi:hypothetical protein
MPPLQSLVGFAPGSIVPFHVRVTFSPGEDGTLTSCEEGFEAIAGTATNVSDASNPTEMKMDSKRRTVTRSSHE